MISSRENLRQTLRTSGIPEYMWEGIERYLFDRVRPGSFLSAIFQNDLVEAFACADTDNLELMRYYARFLYNELPARNIEGTPWGSRAAFEKWLDPIFEADDEV